MSKWYYSKDGQAVGPVNEDFIKDEIRAGRLTLIDLVFLKGDNKWKPISEFSELAELTKTSTINLTSKNESEDRDWVVLKKQMGAGQNQYDQIGPFTMNEVLEKLNQGEIKYSDHIWRAGFKKWTRIGHLPEFDRREKSRESGYLDVPLPEDLVDSSGEPDESLDLAENILQIEKKDLFKEEAPPEEARGEDLAKPSLADIPDFADISPALDQNHDAQFDSELRVDSDDDEIDLSGVENVNSTDSGSLFTESSDDNDFESLEDLSALNSEDSIAPNVLAGEEEIKLSELGSTDEIESQVHSELEAKGVDVDLGEEGKTGSVLAEDHLVGGPSLEDVEEQSGLAEETVNMSQAEILGDEFTGSVQLEEPVQDPLQAGPQVPEPVDPPEPEEPEEVSPEREERAEAATKLVDPPQNQREDQVNYDRKEHLRDSFVEPSESTGTASVTSDFKKPLEKSFTAIEEEHDALKSIDSEENKGNLAGGEPSQFDISLSDIEEELESDSKGVKEEADSTNDDTVQLEDPQPERLIVKKSNRSQALSDEFNVQSKESIVARAEETTDDSSENQGFFDVHEESAGLFGLDAESEAEESEFNSFDDNTSASSKPIEDQDVSKIISIEEINENQVEGEESSFKKKSPIDLGKIFVPLALITIVSLVGFGLYISYPKWKSYVENFDPMAKVGEVDTIIVDNEDPGESLIPDPPDEFPDELPPVPDSEFESVARPTEPTNQEVVDKPKPEPVVKEPAPVVAQETPQPKPPTKPAKKASRLSVIGQSMSTGSARLRVTSNASPGTRIRILARGESGRVLGRVSYYRNLTRKADKNGNLILSLKDIGAPIGSLVFEVSLDSLKRKIDLFHGVKNNDFNKKLRAHLKQISLAQQSQKKAIIYTSRGLEALTARLIRNATRLRTQPRSWGRFYRQWKIDRAKGLLPQFKDAMRAPRQKQAYPSLISELEGAYRDLGKEAQNLDSSIRSKRTMASRGSLQIQKRFAAIKRNALNLSNYR